MSFSNSFYRLTCWAFPATLLSDKCHRIPLMTSQRGLAPSAMTRTNVYPESLGQYESKLKKYNLLSISFCLPQGGSDLGEAVFGIVQILAHLVSRVSRPQFCWGLAILCDPPFFSGYIEFGGVVVKFYSSVEITLYLLADFLLQYVILFQSRDIVKNLVSL